MNGADDSRPAVGSSSVARHSPPVRGSRRTSPTACSTDPTMPVSCPASSSTARTIHAAVVLPLLPATATTRMRRLGQS